MTTLLVIFSLISLGAAALLGVLRLAIGPHMADRTAALDLLAAVGYGGLLVFHLVYPESYALDVALFLALLAFVSTIGFAKMVDQDRG